MKSFFNAARRWVGKGVKSVVKSPPWHFTWIVNPEQNQENKPSQLFQLKEGFWLANNPSQDFWIHTN